MSIALVATLLAASPVSRREALAATTPTPVAEWTFDEGSGTTAADSIGNLDGAISGGATWVSSGAPQGSGALSFDGVDDVVTIPNGAAVEPTGSFSVSAWVKSADPADTANFVILQKGYYGCEAGGSWTVRQVHRSTEASVKLASSTFRYPAYSDERVPTWDGNWHRMVMVVDEPNGKLSAWLDGYRSSRTWQGPDEVDFGADGRLDSALLIGNATAECPYDKPFHGGVDDLQIYDRALTDAEVLSLMPTHETSIEAFVNGKGVPVPPLYVDEASLFSGLITPFPGVDGDTNWYLTKDGGPEVLYATTNIAASSQGATFLRRDAGSLSPGSYSIRAEWVGVPNWEHSESAAVPFSVIRRGIDFTMNASPSNTFPGGAAVLTARVKLNPANTTYRVDGDVWFYETTDGNDVLLGSAGLSSSPADPTWNIAALNLSGLSAGQHTYEARFAGTETIDEGAGSASVAVMPQGSYTALSVAPNPVLDTESSTATVSIATYAKAGGGGALPSATGTVSVKRSSTGATIATRSVAGGGPYTFDLPPFAAGTVGLVATYSGDTHFDPSTSDIVDLVSQSNVVDAAGVGVNYGTFYPYKDGYRDSVAVRGTRNEPISVVIAIYSPTGTRVRLASIPRASGGYSYAWNGRNSSGTILASGKYKVVQTLTDAAGLKRTYTSYTTLSKKRLYYSTTYVTKLGSAVSSKGDSGPGSISLSTSSGVAKLVGKYPDGWVGVGYQFTLPSATAYKSLSFQAYTKGALSAPPSEIAVQNFVVCPYSSTWDYGCFDHWNSAVATTNVASWVSTTAHPGINRSGRTVRGVVSVPFGTLYIYKVRVKVTIGVLK